MIKCMISDFLFKFRLVFDKLMCNQKWITYFLLYGCSEYSLLNKHILHPYFFLSCVSRILIFIHDIKTLFPNKLENGLLISLLLSFKVSLFFYYV